MASSCPTDCCAATVVVKIAELSRASRKAERRVSRMNERLAEHRSVPDATTMAHPILMVFDLQSARACRRVSASSAEHSYRSKPIVRQMSRNRCRSFARATQTRKPKHQQTECRLKTKDFLASFRRITPIKLARHSAECGGRSQMALVVPCPLPSCTLSLAQQNFVP